MPGAPQLKPRRPSNTAGTCLWCGERLRHGGKGYEDNGYYCSLRCGYLFAREAADAQFRLEPQVISEVASTI